MTMKQYMPSSHLICMYVAADVKIMDIDMMQQVALTAG